LCGALEFGLNGIFFGLNEIDFLDLWDSILRVGWFCDFGKKPSERDAFDFLIFLQKNQKIKSISLHPARSQAERLLGEIPKPSCAKYNPTNPKKIPFNPNSNTISS
jgi:hypothetical protein